MTEDKRLLILGSKSGGGGGAETWGQITGTLSNQTDLQNALDAKADSSSVPTKTSDLTNDSGFRRVIDINDMTQAELIDFYTNYETLMAQNTYVVDGHEAVATTMQHTAYGTVLILESNVRYKNEFAGAAPGTIDALGTATYIFADGSKKRDNLTFNLPETSGLATVATSGSYNDLSNKPTIPTVDVTAAGDNTFTGDNIFTKDTLIGDLSDIALNLTVDTYSMPQIEGTDLNTSKSFYINTDGIVFNDANLGDNTGLGITLDGTTGDVTVYAGYGGIDLQAGSVTVNGQPIGGGVNDWYGSKEMFDLIPENELDDDTNYYIADRLDWSEIANTPSIPTKTSQIENDSYFTTYGDLNLAIYNAKKAIEDSFVFCTQSEYEAMSLAGTLKEDTKYIIQGTQNKLEMVVTFTDTTTATYNVYVE